VPQVDDGRAGDVVGIEGALLPVDPVRFQSATADPVVEPVGAQVGVGPQHAELWLAVDPVRRVAGLCRRRDLVAEPVEVGQVGQRDGRHGRLAGGQSHHQRGEQGEHEGDDGAPGGLHLVSKRVVGHGALVPSRP
jgi:hypothetical protein